MEEQQEFFNSYQYPNDPAKADRMQEIQLKHYREISKGTFEFSDCDPFRCQTVEGEKLLDGQSIAYWQEVLSVDVGSELKNIPSQTKVHCIGGESDWIVFPAHASENCNRLASLGLTAKVTIISELDHFLSVAPTREDSVRVLLSGNLEGLKLNVDFRDQVRLWLKAL
jgi:hypothetical protein